MHLLNEFVLVDDSNNRAIKRLLVESSKLIKSAYYIK